MKPVTVITQYTPGALFEKTLSAFTQSGLVENVVIISQEPVHTDISGCQFLVAGPLQSGHTLGALLSDIRTEYLLILHSFKPIAIESTTLENFLAKAASTKAGMVYSNFYDINDEAKTLHPLNDYQTGSIRDDFDFGAMTLYSLSAIRKALDHYGPIPSVQFAGLYDIRLKVSIDHAIYHLQDPLYSVFETTGPSSGENIFTYVDPRNAAVQKEMELVCTDYLKYISAYLPPDILGKAKASPEHFPIEASVVIPVKNRMNTIAEAVKSALSQEVDFPFNVIVVDNHSTDGTTDMLADLVGQYSALHHIIPARTDLGIGGCWNEALQSQACGRYAVQLDSDDLYSTSHTLQTIVDKLRHEKYAMVIGSYTIVNFDLEEIPPGLIDHREWTDTNGHNNALRINGLGAPRAFNTSLMRDISFLNVSYGEDYAAALRICREHRIGRIFECLYLCRRWSGNTDALLSIEATNRNDAFKDKVRTDEILARQTINSNRPR